MCERAEVAYSREPWRLGFVTKLCRALCFYRRELQLFTSIGELSDSIAVHGGLPLPLSSVSGTKASFQLCLILYHLDFQRERLKNEQVPICLPHPHSGSCPLFLWPWNVCWLKVKVCGSLRSTLFSPSSLLWPGLLLIFIFIELQVKSC